MLNKLDKELEDRNLRYTRYADDVVIVTKSKASANRVMHSIIKWIERKLGLKVNATKTKITTPAKLKYLGFGFYYNNAQKAYKSRPHQESIQSFKRKLKQLTIRTVSYTHLDVYKRQVLDGDRDPSGCKDRQRLSDRSWHGGRHRRNRRDR